MKLKFSAGALGTAMTLAVTLAASMALPAYAQKPAPAAATQVNTETGSPVARVQLKMDAKEFMRSHRWDEETDTWRMKTDMMPPSGVMSRAEVKAQRDLFLSKNKWNNVNSRYESIGPVPRNMSTLTRAEVKAETIQFMRTHDFNEETSTWVEVPYPARKPKAKM